MTQFETPGPNAPDPEPAVRKSPVDTEAQSPGRDERGRFTDGNPGRPPGARNKATLLAEVLFDGEAEFLARTAVEHAMAGNMTALRLCLDRLMPRRERTVAVDLPPVETAADALKAAGRLVALVGAGELTPGEGRALAAMVETQRRAIETEDLERRIIALEGSPG